MRSHAHGTARCDNHRAGHVFRDPRGFFLETYHADKYRSFGIAGPFLQDNHSRSAARTIRGLAYAASAAHRAS